jgi:hypothetical protein
LADDSCETFPVERRMSGGVADDRLESLLLVEVETLSRLAFAPCQLAREPQPPAKSARRWR